MSKSALIVGAGPGISASFARKLAGAGYHVTLAARDTAKLADLNAEIKGNVIGCNVLEAGDVDKLFAGMDQRGSSLDVVLYNPSFRERGPFLELDPERTRKALMVTAYGGFLVAQHAAKRMMEQGSGNILFTGASASVKGYAQSAPFAMGKFALRGLAQSMARELAPHGIHVAHFVIDGGVRNPERAERIDAPDNPDSMLDPDAIADTYMHVLSQPRSAWTWEVELRPWVERF
ncbi:MAG: SDR family NAD(P)-dependent oxidoreductase [Hyphomicrobiaceae bacterium]